MALTKIQALLIYFFYTMAGIGFLETRMMINYGGNSILIMENSDLGGCETLETPNIFLFPRVLSFITILIWIGLF